MSENLGDEKMNLVDRERLKHIMPLVITILTLMQPILDIITSQQLAAGASVTIGVIFRTLIMAGACIYTVFFSRFDRKKWCMLYIAVISVYIVLFFLVMANAGGIYVALQNVKDVIKTFFFLYVLCFFYAVYAEYGALVSDRTLTLVLLFSASTIMLAYITGTSNTTYASGYGFCGWFSSANEVSDMIIILAPVSIFVLLQKVVHGKWWQYIGIILLLLMLCLICNLIGTKLVFAVILLYFVLCGGWNFIAGFARRENRKTRLISGTICLFCTVFMLVGFSNSPLSKYIENIYVPMMDSSSEIYQASINEDWIDEKNTEDIWMLQVLENNAAVSKINSIFSRRFTGMAYSLQAYMDGGMDVKLFGIGYIQMDRYKYQMERMVEMDPLLILIRHGILGICIFLLPILALMVWVIVRWLQHPLKNLQDLRYCTYIYSFLIIIVMSFVAGHTLPVPSVSYYVILIIMQIVCITKEAHKNAMLK